MQDQDNTQQSATGSNPTPASSGNPNSNPTPQPTGGQPTAGGQPFPSMDYQIGATQPGGATSQPEQPEDTTPANFQLGALLPAQLNVPVQTHNLNFNEEQFLRLLAGSISLSREEKKRIIDTIPKLRQSQVDELIRIFEEESIKFSQLSKKHVPQLEKLAKQHAQDWLDLETSYKAETKNSQDQAAADDIRKSLGL